MAILIKVTLDHERTTKRYHVYTAPEGTLIPRSIYVPIVPREEPAPMVTLTVEAEEE